MGRHLTVWALSALCFATGPAHSPLNPSTPQVVASCPLPAPTGFTATGAGGTSVTLTWNAVPDADAYRLTVYDLNTMAVVISRVEYGAGASISGLSPGATYRCVLSSVCASGATSSFIIVTDIAF